MLTRKKRKQENDYNSAEWLQLIRCVLALEQGHSLRFAHTHIHTHTHTTRLNKVYRLLRHRDSCEKDSFIVNKVHLHFVASCFLDLAVDLTMC